MPCPYISADKVKKETQLRIATFKPNHYLQAEVYKISESREVKGNGQIAVLLLNRSKRTVFRN